MLNIQASVQEHSFKTRPGGRPGGRPGIMIGLRVRWVDPGQSGSTQKNLMQVALVAAAATTANPVFNTSKLSLPSFKMPTTIFYIHHLDRNISVL